MMTWFGMLAMALLAFALRQVLTDAQWARPKKFIRVSFVRSAAGDLARI
jgi:nitric oxide reductase subunit B